MDASAIRAKFGDDYEATERTYRLGIDARLTRHIAARYLGLRVVETCTGGGFTTIALARVAAHVKTVEIDPFHQQQARENVRRAGLDHKVEFVLADTMSAPVLDSIAPTDAAFLDPDWAISGANHLFRFRDSNMQPPADLLLESALRRTRNVAIILPPGLALEELQGLPGHERQSLFLGEEHVLYCLYFGALARSARPTALHAGQRS